MKAESSILNRCASWIVICLALIATSVVAATSPQVFLERGRACWESGDFVEAIELFHDALDAFRAVGNQRGEAEALQGLGMCCEDLGRFAEARDHYEAALGIFKTTRNRVAEADSHICLGWTHLGLGLHGDAFDHFEEAHGIFLDIYHPNGLQRSLHGMSEAILGLANQDEGFRSDGDAATQSAILYLEKALIFYRLEANISAQAYCLLYMAQCHAATEDVERAATCLEEALSLFRDVGDRTGKMQATHQMAWLHETRGDWGEAVASYEMTIELARALGDRRRVADAYLSIAYCRMEASQFREALRVLEYAREEFSQLLDPMGEIECVRVMGVCYAAAGNLKQADAMRREAADMAGEAGIWTLRADLLCELASSKMPRGEFQEAIDALKEAQTLYQQEEHGAGIASCLTMLGDCYQMLASYDVARAHFEGAYALSKAIGDRANEADSLRGIGVCDYYAGDYSEAIAKTKAALAIFRSIPGDDLGEAWCLFQIGATYETMRSLVRAVEYTEQALEIFRRCGDDMGIQAALTTLGSCQRALGDRNETLAHYEAALETALGMGAAHEAWSIEWSIGSLYKESGDLEKALDYYASALARAESILGAVQIEGAIQSYLGRMTQAYAEYLDLLLRADRQEETLQAVERCRARTFLDMVDVDMEIDLTNTPERGIRARVVDASALDEDLRMVVEELPLHTAALEYFVAGPKAYLWIIKRGTVEGPLILDCTLETLRDDVIRLRQSIETSADSLSALPEPSLLALCGALYEALVRPAEAYLTGINHLIIVPSGPLFYLPFSVLIDCPSCSGMGLFAGEQLIGQYSLSYTPSLSTLRYCAREQVDEVAHGGFLAFADPDSGDPTLPRLPNAHDEAQAVTAVIGAGDVYSGEEATEDRLKEGAQGVGGILLSTHGVFDPGNPMYSYLQLAPSTQGDGRLYTYEVFGLSLTTDLVTLSACETLLPALADAQRQAQEERGLMDDIPVELDDEILAELTAGDDIAGLTRAFIYAGSSSVLSTLWRVVSQTTEPLMVAFYTYLKEGLDKAEALRQAQLDVMANYPHPRYWAAFELVGDWR